MAQHGYLREYDEGWGRGDERERGWRGGYGNDRGRGFMLGERERDRSWGRDDDRSRGGGLFGRIADEARSWFDDEDDNNRGRRERGRPTSGYGREHGFGGFQGDYGRSGREQGGFGGSGDYEGGRRSFSAHPDDHYRSWREKQLQALDRDYADYCREREQQFHQEFDSWRQSRQQRGQSQQGQMAASGRGPTAGRGTSTDAPQEPQSAVSAESAATLGTNQETETPSRGRGRM
jgi:hypothetical protein